MRRIFGSFFLFCASFFFALDSASAVTISTVPVGNAGNAGEVQLQGTFGAVAYNYRIGATDVTNAQYAEFLNTKDPTGANTLGLWTSNMANATYGGISFNGGNPSGSKYVLTVGRQDHPVNYVNWYDTIRFANWLNNGQGSGDTETGAYTLGALDSNGVPIDGLSITRNPGATWFLPSENEWYKAAFYDPRTSAEGGPPLDSHYWQYATSTNATPTASGPTALANHANYNNVVGNLTDVGAYAGTRSPYGAFDMAGNVFQWNEAILNAVAREIRGGSFNFDASYLHLRGSDYPTDAQYYLGFRVATVAIVPEPSSIALAAFGFVGLVAWRLRRSC